MSECPLPCMLLVLWRPEESTKYPETGFPNVCGLLCGCWE